MPEELRDYSPVDVTEALTLVVGWKSGPKTKLGRVPLTEEVADAFRASLTDVVDNMEEREAERWAPDADVTPETYLVASRETLGDKPELSALPFSADDLAAALMLASDVPELRADQLPAADLSFYAVVIGDDAEDRTVFLRRANPRRGLRRGKWFTSFADALVKVDDPIFSFDDQVDLIFQDDVVLILSQTAFAMLFRSNEELTAQVPRWVKALEAHVPITKKGAKRLQVRALRDSRIKRRLEAIVTRGHLEDVSAEHLRAEMEALELNADALLNNKDRLTLEDEDIPEVLQFLNEDLFYGALTKEGFRADKKQAR